MIKKPSPTLIGAFVLLAALLVVVAIATWGSGRLFQRTFRCVCYFPGSVNGLNIGSPVKSRGVPIGTVVDMRLSFEQRPDDTRIPVFIELYARRLRELGFTEEPTLRVLDDLIASGMRARLERESLLTGLLYVNLDRFPDTKVELSHTGGRYPEIPAIPTALEEATKSLTALLDHLKEADVAGVARSLAQAVEGIDRLVNTPAVLRTLNELPSTIASFRQLARGLDSQVGDVAKSLVKTLEGVQEGVGGARTLLAPRGPVVVELQRTLIDVQRAADSFRTLAEFLQRNPNALLVGRKRPQ